MKKSGAFSLVAAWIKSLFSHKSSDECIKSPRESCSSPDLFVSPISSATPQPVVQTDVRDKKIRMRVRRSIDKQLAKSHQYAQKPHGADCPDIFFCKKNACFKREPDKIVSPPYTIDS